MAIGAVSLSDSLFKRPIGIVLGTLLDLGLRFIPGAGAFTAGGYLDIPLGRDTLGHFVAWGMIGFVAAGVFRRARWRLLLLGALFALSALIEVGQQYLSWSRSAELSDLAANGFGLVAGFVAFIVIERVVRFIVPDLDLRKEELIRHLRSP